MYEGTNCTCGFWFIDDGGVCRCGARPAIHARGARGPDKGGHRVKAIALVNNAIAEVDAGIAYDRRHNHAVAFEQVFAVAGDQPHMTAALTAIESAKNNLQRATADKGGHRGRAIDIINDAISEVKKGIDAAR